MLGIVVSKNNPRKVTEQPVQTFKGPEDRRLEFEVGPVLFREITHCFHT